MSKKLITESILSDIADAIRNKIGSTDTIKPINMASRINDISPSPDYSNQLVKVVEGTPSFEGELTEISSRYADIEYVENLGGTQYIDTGFIPNQDTKVEMKVKGSNIGAYWFGCWKKDYNSGAYAVGNDGTSVYCGYDGQGGGVGSSVIDDGEHTITMEKNNVYVDGELFKSFNYATFDVSYNLYLFAQNRAGTEMIYTKNGTTKLYEYANFKLVECSIYDNSETVRHYLPKLMDDITPGLYDTVNKKFYENAGTGSFTYEGVD